MSNPYSWWHHQIEPFSVLQAICAGNSPVPDEFPAQKPVTRSFDVFFDLRLNQRLSKQSWGWCFETIPRLLWLLCNVQGSYMLFMIKYRAILACHVRSGSTLYHEPYHYIDWSWLSATIIVPKRGCCHHTAHMKRTIFWEKHLVYRSVRSWRCRVWMTIVPIYHCTTRNVKMMTKDQTLI